MLMFLTPSFEMVGSWLPEVRLDGLVENRGREVEYRNEAVGGVASAGWDVDNDGLLTLSMVTDPICYPMSLWSIMDDGKMMT
jgi:hypothetical protein